MSDVGGELLGAEVVEGLDELLDVYDSVVVLVALGEDLLYL